MLTGFSFILSALIGIAAWQRDANRRRIKASAQQYQMISELLSDYAYSLRIHADGSRSIEWAVGPAIMLGYERDDLALNFNDYVHPAFREAAQDHDARALAGETSSAELRVIARDGSARWVYVKSNVSGDPELPHIPTATG